VWIAAALTMSLAVRFKLAGHHEWSLLADLLRRYVRPPVSLPTMAELEALSFDAAWNRLRTAIASDSVDRIAVSVRDRNGAREHVWQSDLPGRPAELLALEIDRFSGEQQWCRLRIETSHRRFAANVNRLIQVSERFAEFWSVQPATVPAATLRLHYADGIKPHQQDGFGRALEQSRAA
jgi:hypothetical protein